MAATTLTTSHESNSSSPTIQLRVQSVSSKFASGLLVVRPGDTVSGRVMIPSDVDLRFKTITVAYIGVESTLASPRWPGDSASYQFLRLPYRCDVQQDLSVKDGDNLYSNPFEFTLPPGITSANDRASPPCRQFPPSFRVQKSAHWDMQAPDVRIAYFIQAEVSYELLTKAGWEEKELKLARPVECIPYIDVQPPIETTCFAAEYVMRAEHTVWSSIFGRKVGTVVIETQEPPPLKYTSDHTSTSSTISLKFQVQSTGTHQLMIKSVEIHPVLCMKQFRSRDKLKGTPRVDQATDDGALRVSQDVVDLEKHVVSEFQWMKERKREGDCPPAYQRLSVSGGRPQAVCKRASDQALACQSQTEQPSESGIEENSETWTTDLKVAVRPPTRLLPNFCSHYNALAYSLIYRVAIFGVHTKSIYLSVPLQVSYPSHEILPNGTVAADERSSDPVEEFSTTDEACCVSVVSSFDVDHILPNYSDLPW